MDSNNSNIKRKGKVVQFFKDCSFSNIKSKDIEISKMLGEGFRSYL